MHPTLSRHLKVEAVRQIESEGRAAGSDNIDARLANDDASFQQKLFTRSDYLAELLGIHRAHEQLAGKIKLTGLLACFLCIGLGFFAAGNAFNNQDSATVNFYWLVLVLTGFNLLSMLVWFGVMMANYQTDPIHHGLNVSRSGFMFSALRWILSLTISGDEAQAQKTTFSAWNRLYSNSGLAVWAVSRTSHLLWLCYLGGGLGMVLVMLSVREYNFGWATTILDAGTFIDLTQWLAALPNLLGWSVPSREMVAASRLDSLADNWQSLDAQAVEVFRSSWATLLLSSLVLYGIVPRLLLLLFCHWKVKQAILSYQADYSHPYFLDLQQRLVPVTRSLGVVDPDEQQPLISEQVPASSEAIQLPENPHYLSIELLADSSWPPTGIDPKTLLGDANDAESQQQALEKIEAISGNLICVVALLRSPDRGTARYLKEVKAHSPVPVYLMIFGDFPAGESVLAGGSELALDNESTAGMRLGDWHRLAEQLDISADQLLHMRRKE